MHSTLSMYLISCTVASKLMIYGLAIPSSAGKNLVLQRFPPIEGSCLNNGFKSTSVAFVDPVDGNDPKLCSAKEVWQFPDKRVQLKPFKGDWRTLAKVQCAEDKSGKGVKSVLRIVQR